MQNNEKDNKRKLYDAISKDYDMGSYEQFAKDIQDERKRKKLYDAISKDYDMGDYGSFSNQLGFGGKTTASAKPSSTAQKPQQKMTAQQKAQAIANVEGMMRGVKQSMADAKERIGNITEYGKSSKLNFGHTVRGKMQYNPAKGKMEQTYLTPTGNRYGEEEKGLADYESQQYRQAADVSVSGQLRKAHQKLDELKEKREKSAQRVHEETTKFNDEKLTPLGRALIGGQMYTGMQMGDKENNALDVAIRQTEELIKDLEEQQDREAGKDVGFWRGFGRTVSDYRTWDFGMGDLKDAMTMMNADQLKGKNATKGEREAHNEMMSAIANKQQAEQMYGGNASFWNRAGVMTGYMPSFMLDFVVTGGGYEIVNAGAKLGTKAGVKILGKNAVKEMAEQGFKSYVKKNGVKGFGQYATNWTVKALGTTADDLLVRAPLMTNTVQLGKTTADIIDRKLGDVVVDENGNYDFSNDKTWGSAIWQGEANAIIENYSEMFGAHLDPVMSLKNMSKLANVVGAKRLGGVLAKADAGALSGLMGRTHEMFNKMGVSDYVGEVSEEYYGQLWRTMLDLDDAYQENPDGTRTNLFKTGQFHGDIWGGMALSMGLMGAGKHTLNAATYVSMKHGVNKADAHASEILGTDVWEPLRATLDLATNDNIGDVADAIVNDKDFTNEEKAAVLTYMERSLNMRGFNLATLAQKRGGEQDKDQQSLDESYLDGYNMETPQEMTDAKNMLDYQRQRITEALGEDILTDIDNDPEGAIGKLGVDEATNDMVLDYLNARQVYNGMIQRVRDDMDGRIRQSEAMIGGRVHRTTGMIQPATMKQDDRKVYVVRGNLVQYEDGNGIDLKESDESIIVRDAETGKLEQVAPDAILNIDEPLNVIDELTIAREAIKQQFAQEAANKIDGKLAFNPGDVLTINDGGGQTQITIIGNATDENGMPIEGQVVVQFADGTQTSFNKDALQQFADAANIERVQEFEQKRTEGNAVVDAEQQEAARPQYAMNDLVTLKGENGNAIRGNITADEDADGKFEVYTEDPINGRRVNQFTRDELDNMLIEHNGTVVEQPSAVEAEGDNTVEEVPENGNIEAESIPEITEVVGNEQEQETEDVQPTAFERIPKDEQGNPIYEQTDAETAWDAIVEQTEGDEAVAQAVANGMVADKQAALAKAEKAKSKGGTTIAEKIVAEKERASAINNAKAELEHWQKIAATANRRKMEAESERRKVAEQLAAQRRADEERLRAEKEEAERIEREALYGVPDMVDDTPQDARARGYRRQNGHKIDRQEPVQGVQGKEVDVKFSDKETVKGRVAVIEAEQLQPSHVQGSRNAKHFIDEAQPKERNDSASVLSARKIAGNIRPEEITSSITAYTGAPTVNARGEVIQGNNRSDALRLMWQAQKEQSSKYKQYLKDHAEEFGVNAEDVDKMQHPVLVNMLDVDDDRAIELGQFVAQDTESGGTERIKPKNAVQKMGTDMRTFANLLLQSSNDEDSFASLVDKNGVETLKWMNAKGHITPTQYQSAFDSKGNLTAEAKNDLKGIMYQSIFQGGSTRLEEMFNAMPAKAQKAILATAYRDYDSPNAERMIVEIQNSIHAFNALSGDEAFVTAKNYKEARMAVEAWKRQYQFDDATGESYLPAEKFSNFALHLATMYRGETQGFIQATFNKLYDLVQGTQEENLFEHPDNTPRTLVQAIKETLNIDYNGQQRSNVLVGDSAASQPGQQGSTGNAATGERVEDRERTADSGGRIEGDSRGSRFEDENRGNQGKETEASQDITVHSLTADEAQDFIADMELSADEAPEIDLTIKNWDALFGEGGIVNTPIGEVKMGEHQFAKLMRQGREGKLGMIKPTLENPHAIIEEASEAKEGDTTERASSYIFIRSFKKADGSRFYYFTSITVSKDGKEVVVSSQEKSRNKILRLLQEGNVIWRTPKDATTSSAERQGLDYEQPDKAETAAKGSGITPQSTPSADKVTTKSPITNDLGEKIAKEEEKVDVNPTEKQKEAGNYKKGHVQVGTFNVTIENPKGSVRSGVDANGNKWETEMHNTYGYIRGTEGADGDHIDVFLSDDIDGWNGRKVYVIDQYNPDGTFDEHKVMLGFNDVDEAKSDYLANYEKGWEDGRRIDVSTTNLEDFEKWIASSHRKTKAFAEYKSVKTTEGKNASADGDLKHNLTDFKEGDVVSDYYDKKLYRIKKHSSNGITTLAELDAEGNEVNTTTLNTHNNPRFSIAEAPVKDEASTISQEKEQDTEQDGNALYSIEPAQYTTKRGKVLDMHLVKFDTTLTKEQQRAAKELAKAEKGWYDAKQGGFMMRSEESARKLADTIIGNEEAVSDAQPVSMTDVQAVNNGEVVFSEPQQPKKQDEKSQPVWQYSISVDKKTGLTTLTRDDVSGVVPIGDARFHHTAESPEEMLGFLRNPQNGMQEVLDAVGVTLENKIKTRELDRKANEEKAQPQQAEMPTNSGQFGLVSDKRMEELKSRLRKKMFGGQLNCGIDPEILTIGIELTAGHIDRGIKKFADFAKVMIEDLGDAIRPYLKAFYNGARDMPEIIENGLSEEMTPYDEVRTFDVANFDKTSIDAMATAETVARETEVEQEVEIAHKRIKEKRNTRKKSEKKSVTSQQSSELSLFDGIDNNIKEKEDGRPIQELSPSDGTQRKGDSENGVGRADRRRVLPPQSRDIGSTTDVEQGRVDGDIQGRGNDGQRNSGVQGGRSQSETQRGGSGLSDDAVAEKKNTRNNHSERGEDHAPTSVNARIEANIKAIELAQQLIESGETATPEQMAVLRKFSGWGGLGAAFNTSSYDWKIRERNQKIMQLLGKDAYQQAVMSANSAYYTPAYVVDTLWDIAEKMGFKGGNILEGSAGIGNILGQMPTRISERSDIHAVEIDSTSGGILSLLYPDANVEIQGFEQTRIPNGSVDLAITNVPFVTGLRVNDTTGDKDLSRKFYNIHDFCIAKNVRKLREGGLGIFITSNGTLDNSKKLRDWIVGEGGADFVGAFRMNNKTFGGTGVTSDIIVIRKRVNGKKSANAIDVSTVTGERMAEFDTGDTRKVKGQTLPVIKHLSMDYNQYFIEHPENMAGEMRFAFENGETFRPTSKGLYPTANKKQTEMLASWVGSLAEKKEESAESTVEDEATHINEQLGKGVKEGSMVLNSQRELCMARMGEAVPLGLNKNKVKGHSKAECFKAYSAIKDALSVVLAYQAENEDDKGLKPLITKLNTAYDNFVDTYGHFNKNTAIAFLRNDVDYANVASIETFKEVGDGKGGVKRTFGKAGVMTGRVVEKDKEPTPTNIKDGVIASMFKFGKVDASYIAEQLGKEKAAVEAEIIESGLGFRDPISQQIEVSYQYQSGNVREKLRQAQENNENGEYDRNIKALQEVMPMDIPAHLIDFTLGSSWIDPKLYEEYVKERTDVDVRFTAVGGSWFMDTPSEWQINKEKNRSMGVVSEMLGKTIMGHTLIEAAIQNKSVTVSTTNRTWDGKTETITDKEATQACVAKIVEIRQDFKDWARQKMQGDTEMSERMERVYNDAFNNYVPMSIPEEFVPEFFGGASHKFRMRPHQGKAIVRGTMQPLLLAHEVGSGKTFTLISTAMEMRRLGTARKPMIVVQNATVGQFVASAKELYPNAKILTLEEADRSAEGRKNFYAKIRYNDWDMIVVPQSTFEFIPDSEERRMVYVQDKIEEKMLVLEKMREADPDGKSMITRQAEREIAALEEELAGLSNETSKKRTANDEKKRAVAMQNAEVKAMEMLDRKTDNVENFDDMGIDALLIDEAHEYKHLGFATAMQRGVKGVDSSYSKKSQGVYLKTQAVLEKNNGRNVVFATGTPISNTAAEIWTFMRYLMPADKMKEYGIYYFDDFVRNFGNVQPMLEFTTSGKFKENNRFAGYVNLPELVRIWSGVADTVRFKEIEEDQRKQGKPDLRPDIEGGKAQDIYLPQTRALRAVMKYVKSELEAYDKMSGKEKKENSHIPLVMYGIAKAAAVDARLVQTDAEDDPNSKTNEAVRQTLRSLKETDNYKGTVAIFADNFQNKQSGFNIYEDIRRKLIEKGVSADVIVVMKSGMTIKNKLEVFEKVNRGEVRVILGSTFTLGTGVNIQERLHTLIHLDAPNRPMDYTQRNGRIHRQGNIHKEMGKPVRILRFGVEDSLDVTAYQRLKTKGAIADSVMNGKELMTNSMTNRVLEEEEDAFGDTVAQLSGSEFAMLKNNAEKNVRKYASRKKQWEADQTYIHNAKPKVNAFIKDAEARIEESAKHLHSVQEAFPNGEFSEIVISKHHFKAIGAMEDFFKEHNKGILAEVKKMKDNGISGEQTRELSVSLGGFTFKMKTVLSKEMNRDGGSLFAEVHRKMTYSCAELGLEDIPVKQALLRNGIDDIVNNVITGKDFSERLDTAERNKKHYEAEKKELLSREGKPFAYEKELKQAQEQYEEYSEAMKKELEEKEAKYAEMDADINAANDVSLTAEDEDVLYRSDDTMYRIREEAPPKNTGIGYKVFLLKKGGLYPPMVANPNGEATPVGVWLDADAAPVAGQSKTGRNQVKAGGKGTQGGSGKLAYRPGWHLGFIPYAIQFNRMDENGKKTLFPSNFVWAEVEYANDVDYQEEAMSYGYSANGKFRHSYAGLPRVPENGAYTYRTNPNPETDPWIITGAMRVKRILTPTEVDEIVKSVGREPQRRQDGGVTDAEINALNAELAMEDYRDGVGSYTDDELSYENDPVSKMLGKSRFTRRQRRVFAERERQRMAEHVKGLAKKLHLDNVEIITDASQLEGKKQRAKGFYSKSTSKITIVIPNHANILDVEQTLLHEAVAHYGLRQLFGEHFDTFLDNVFNNAEKEIRERIVALASKNGWDFRTATEEYLAGLAEDTEFENMNASWWRQIKDFFLRMLHKIGFENFRGVTLSDNELRYILWRSYENLTEPGRYRSILGEAADVAMQYNLKVGNYAVENNKAQSAAENGTLYRNGDPETHERTLARDRYEQRVKSGMFQSQEALQDSMLGLKEAIQAILGKRTNMEDVDGFENAYLGENALSSINKAEADAFGRTVFKPLLDETALLAKNLEDREELMDYMMAKHGLERNQVMAERDAQEAFDKYAKEHPQGTKTLQDFINSYHEKDYAGLTALTGMDNVADAEAEAQQMVSDYEQAHNTDELWNKVNAVSSAILSKSYECGMMSKETYEKIKGMYEYYIPLRGFDEKTSNEAYAYLTHPHSAFNAPIKKAEGRKSKADDPIANLQSMAESAIMQGNRNKLVKQRFLNFVLNHPSDLASVCDLWVGYDAVEDEWKPLFPDNIDSNDTPEEVERKMQDFETKMKALAQQYPDNYKKGKDAIGIPYRVVESRDLRQHQILVKRGGRDYVITINGNPRAAQAINGQTNPDNDMSGAIGALLRAGENINRQLSAFYTTRNPDFVVSNFMRDMLYSNSMVWIKESPSYALRFHKNFAMVNPIQMKRLLAKYRKGTLDMGNRTEAMFYQFMMNGGETGYANIRDIEQHKNDIKKELKKSKGRISVQKAWDWLTERLDELNRAIENCARFAAFITSREMGRNIARSIYDAKEISVNFNKKGSGAKFYNSVGQTRAGNTSAFASGLGRSGFVFWNAAIQGTTNFGRQLKRHPAKAFTGMAAMFLLGAIIAYIGGDDDDDDDDKNSYYNLPEYVRRSNILFRVGEHWISIPLPVEYRAFYGMGELMTSTFSGKEHLTGGEIAEQIAGQMTQVLPIDFLEGGGGLNAFVPSSAKPLWEACVMNKGWTGMPIYKDTDYNKDMPEWTKAYKSANKHIVNLAATVNEATGGDPYTKGSIDINPAQVEYILNGYFGGVFGTIDKMTKTVETIAGARDYEPRNVLLVNRLVKAGDERTEARAINNEYFRLRDEHDRLKSRLKHYESDTDNGVFDYAEKIDFLYNSPEYKRYEIFEDYRQEIDALNKELKEVADDEERKDIEAELNEVKKEMISEMEATRKRK